MKEQPFQVGQRVVSLVDAYIIKKGDEKIVLGIKKGCHTWFIDVGLISPVTKTYRCRFCDSPLYFVTGQPFWPEAQCFAPINEQEHKDVRKQLAVLPQDEVPDVKQIKELA